MGSKSTDMKLDGGVPLWGLVDSTATPPPNVSTLEREYYYLTGIVQTDVKYAKHYRY